MRMDETLAVFGVVKKATAHALATTSWDKIDTSVPLMKVVARGGWGLRFTQEGRIV